ncbi:unnamed protein product [Heligmosomoides polygyrus]|uniref:COX assembly mitochondrial protein n=1 Tax=Heligmosomoides polygyrus TaxID=6339 RepID=A0A183G5V8_HELPZ|nr:unnamed protein product [Heligmosomoides polygyrus]
MALTNDLKLPNDDELTVPQEITLSTPWLKAVAPYMAKHCEQEINEFMLRRKELQDPRATLREGAVVTACGVKFLQMLKKTCAQETEKLANCVDQSSARLFMSKCHDDQKVLDACIEEKLHVTRPKMGYFSKLHVYDSKNPAPGTLFVIFFSVVFEDYIAHCTNEQISVHPFSFFLFFFRFTGCSKIT